MQDTIFPDYSRIIKEKKSNQHFLCQTEARYSKTSRRYVCKSCGKKIEAEKKKIKADIREQKRGMRQSIPSMLAKIVIGLILLAANGTKDSGENDIILSFVGLLLLGWGIIPAILAIIKKTKKK